MATAEELLAQMEENPELYTDSIGPVNDVIIINAEERTIELPESERIFGVESDKASERKYFKCPKIVGDNIDLSTLNLFINFKNANNEGDIYAIDDVVVDGDYITFSWKLSKKVTAYKTDASKNQLLSFIFCAKSGEGPDNEWNTTFCSDGIVLEGLEPGESIAEENPDIIQYILERLDSAGTITPEQISGAVEEYFTSNPIEETDPTVPAWAKEEAPDKTLSEEGKAADAKEVGDRLGQLSDEKADNPSTGKVGQIIAILTVDENGKPTSYQAIDKPSGAEISTEELREAVNNYLAENPVSGLSVKEKETLLALFKSIEYTVDMSATIKRLEALFAGEEGIKYTVTYNLTNVTSSDSETTIVEGSAKTIILTADEGFLLDTVTVTMNGEDITSSVYTDGVITITSATGNIVITANAKVASVLAPVYALAEETIFDGATYIDTGYKLFDVDKDWSIEVEFSGTDGTVFAEDINGETADNKTFKLYKFSNYYWMIHLGTSKPANNDYLYTGNVSNVKYILTRSIGTEVINVYAIKDGVKTIDTITYKYGPSILTDFIGKTNNLLLGYSTVWTSYFNGTIHDFKVYERILDTTEINEYLGV